MFRWTRTLVQRWPFAWWIAVVLDHFSRAVVRVDVFRKEPTAAEICAMLLVPSRTPDERRVIS